MPGLGITNLWESLRSSGMPEVMLFLTDGSACRCHWDDTAMLGGVRVALLGDQDRNIVRVVPVDACIGIGIPSPKGVDPVGYRGIIRAKLTEPVESPPVWNDQVVMDAEDRPCGTLR